MANRWGNNRNNNRLCILGSKITVDGDCSHETKRCLLHGKKNVTNLESRDITLPGLYSYTYGISSIHVWMWELDHKKRLSTEELILLNCGTGEDSWESLGLQGDQMRIFIERTDAEAETPIFWPSDVKSQLIGKHPHAGKDWGWEENGATEDKTIGWNH